MALMLVASINAAVDVNGIYHERQAFAERYVDALVLSEHGLVQAPYERLVKWELARRAQSDCYIFGSSHIMAINLSRFPLLAARCNRLVNLGVSSATFEDFVIFMSALLDKKPGSQIYFEIPAWFLEEGENVRWTELSDAYDRAVTKFGLAEGTGHGGSIWRILNLVSASYLHRNAEKLMKDGGAAAAEPQIRSAWPREALDPDDAITDPDGSLTYSSSHEAAPHRPGNFDLFKTPNPLISPKNIRGAEAVLRAFERRGLRVFPIMVPYNPARWRCEASSVCAFLDASASAAQALAARLGLDLMGSYDPRPLGLSEIDFYDDQHVAIESLPKLSNAIENLPNLP